MSLYSQVIESAKTKTARQTSALFGAQMTVLFLGLITVPLISRTFGPADYGRYALVLAVLTFAASFFEFGFFSAGARLLATTNSEQEEREILGSLYVVALLIALTFSLTMWGISFVIDPWLSSSIGSALRLISPLAGLYPVQFMIQQVAQGSNRINRLAAITALPGLWALGAILALNHFGHLTFTNAIWINVTGLLLVSGGILLSFRPSSKGLRIRLKHLLQETRTYGRDVYLGRVIGSSMFDMDKFFISRFVSATSVGFYSLAILAVSPMVTLSTSFATSLFKGFAQQARVPAKVTILNACWLIFAAVTVMFIGPPLVILLFSSKFSPVIALLYPLAVAAIFQGLYQPYNHYLGAHGQGKYLRNIALIFALVSLVFNFGLVWKFGALGAAYATLLSNIIYFGLCYYCYRVYIRTLPVPEHLPPTQAFFEDLYTNTPDPWGLDSRASQLVRYEDYLNLLNPYLKNDKKLLDIGCGKGQITRLVSPHVSEAVGIDVSAVAVTQAQALVPNSHTKYEKGGLPVLHFPAASYDIVLALEVLYYLSAEDQEKALSEIARVLKKGGTALFSVNIGAHPYYSLDGIRTLLAKHFTVLAVEASYGRIYTAWENALLMLEPTPLKPLVRSMLTWKPLVKLGRAVTRVIFGKKGVTMAYVLVSKS